jgi:hypothetical protein
MHFQAKHEKMRHCVICVMFSSEKRATLLIRALQKLLSLPYFRIPFRPSPFAFRLLFFHPGDAS